MPQVYIRTRGDGPAVLIDGKRVVDGKRDPKAARVQDPPPGSARGIAPVLGGGKSASEIEKNPVVEAGSLAATVLVLAALVFGSVNPGAVEEIAQKSHGPCVEKIVHGKKITCPSP